MILKFADLLKIQKSNHLNSVFFFKYNVLFVILHGIAFVFCPRHMAKDSFSAEVTSICLVLLECHSVTQSQSNILEYQVVVISFYQ